MGAVCSKDNVVIFLRGLLLGLTTTILITLWLLMMIGCSAP